jgi:hypothetical protein
MSRERVLDDIRDERTRQDEKWGEQNHRNGTGDWGWPVTIGDARAQADAARESCKRDAHDGMTSWRGILLEEVAEAFAESDPQALRAELVQVAAVAAQWIECIDRRTDELRAEQVLPPTPAPHAWSPDCWGSMHQYCAAASCACECHGVDSP